MCLYKQIEGNLCCNGGIYHFGSRYFKYIMLDFEYMNGFLLCFHLFGTPEDILLSVTKFIDKSSSDEMITKYSYSEN